MSRLNKAEPWNCGLPTPLQLHIARVRGTLPPTVRRSFVALAAELQEQMTPVERTMLELNICVRYIDAGIFPVKLDRWYQAAAPAIMPFIGRHRKAARAALRKNPFWFGLPPT